VEIPGGGGSTVKPTGMENPGGWGVSYWGKPSVGGYGYFLDPHNKSHSRSVVKEKAK